jgi:glycosyltransferase involved in cell wall biosynthesis
MPTPLVSVIVPVYCVAPWLARCVDSLLAQSYAHLQIVLVDDGSTDGSGALCDAYAQKDKRVLALHQPNAGLSAARNTGIDAAQGELLCFVDGDDWCEAEMLETALCALQESAVDCVAWGYFKDFVKASKMIKNKQKKEAHGFAEWLALYENGFLGVSAWGKLFRKRVFENIRFPEGRIFEDMWVFPQIARAANGILVLPQAFYHYVQRGQSITNRAFRPQNMDFLEALESWRTEGGQTVQRVRLRVAWNLLLMMGGAFGSPQNKPYAEQLAKILREERTGFFVPVSGALNFALANAVAHGAPYAPVLRLRQTLKRMGGSGA